MVASATQSKHPPRELRRRVLVPARLRTDAEWYDVRILNISSRGLLIQSPRFAPEGSTVQIFRGDHLIVAEVMWCNSGRSGLRSEERLPVEEILSLKQSRALQLIATTGALPDRRRQSRSVADDARSSGRAMEFAAVGAIAVSLAVGVWTMAERALSGPLANASAALLG
jgi:hypothetical protein